MTSHRHLFPFLTTFAGLALGCSAADTMTEPPLHTTGAALASCSSTQALWRMSVPLPPTPCKDVPTATGNWKGSFLFSSAAPMRLRTYCKHAWNAAVGVTPDWASLQAARPGAELDCEVVSSLAGNVSDEPAIWKPLRKSFHAQAERATSLALTKSRVRVAVVDTAAVPYDALELDVNPHGRAVGRAIADLGCAGNPGDANDCVVEISNHLALRRTPEGSDETRGGHFGTRGDVAAAIYHSVLDWQADFAAQTSVAERLVVNLSLGWAPEWGGGTDPKKMPLTGLAVMEALEFARCHGALPIAAAGNYSEVGSKGPMYPALWESVPAPTEETCEDIVTSIPGGHAAFAGEEVGLYRPLVLAVGAVDWQDRPLGNAREQGLPRLLAYGQAVVTDDVRTGHTRILSGSSMSAATGSGAAGTAWAYDLKLTASEILGILYDSATTLDSGPDGTGRDTEFCLSGTSCAGFAPKRVSVCAATFATTCGGVPCPVAPGCTTVPAHAGTAPELPPDWSAFATFEALTSTPCAGDCVSELPTQVAAPSVGPQPLPGCDVCGLDVASSQLWVTMDARLASISTEIILTTSNGRETLQTRIPMPVGGFPLRFHSDVAIVSAARDATLDFVMADGSLMLGARVSVPVY